MDNLATRWLAKMCDAVFQFACRPTFVSSRFEPDYVTVCVSFCDSANLPTLLRRHRRPGSGKTTLLAELARRGHLCVPEDARAIIQEQVASGGSAVPWADAPRFAELLMRQSILTWEEQAVKHSRGPIYFDRGVGDAFTCADLVGCVLPADLCQQARDCRYRDPVFLAPWWPEIYSTDMERRQTTEEAARTEHAIVKTYTELGYRIVRLPLASPVERADFVLRHSARV